MLHYVLDHDTCVPDFCFPFFSACVFAYAESLTNPSLSLKPVGTELCFLDLGFLLSIAVNIVRLMYET